MRLRPLKIVGKTTEAEFSVNPLTLAFREAGVESRFQRSYSRNNLQLGRACHLFAIFFFVVFAVWDVHVVSGSHAEFWIPLAPAVAAVFLAGLAFSYLATPTYLRCWRPLFAFYVLVTGTGAALAAVLAGNDIPLFYFAGLIFCLLFCYSLIRLTFLWAAASGTAILVIYLASLWAFARPPVKLFLTELFLLAAVNFLGMIICYALELLARRDFALAAALRTGEHRLASETSATADIVNGMLSDEAADPQVERTMLDACLAATGSRFGIIGALDDRGALSTICYSEEALDACAFPRAGWEAATGLTVQTMWERSVVHGAPLVCNDLAADRACGPPRPVGESPPDDSPPQAVGSQPGGSPPPHGRPVESLLAVPVIDGDEVTGMVAVAGRAGGYTRADQETLSRLVAIMNVSRRYRQVLVEARLTSADLERAVRERTAELEAANRELESFAYSVSHDLRAPLRAIDGFSTTVVDEYGDTLDERGRHYLDRVRAAAQRMSRLIDDLLRLSRLSRVETNFEYVDLSGMAHQLVEELRSDEPDRDAEILIADGLVARGDPTLLAAALGNLLSNAWKFTSREDLARIELGASFDHGEPVFFVRDNGAGFDMAHADNLFGVFRRLHSDDEFPGTGVGLATVQRIVSRHGGRVWAEAAVGRGATFYFTLGTPP